MAENNVGYFVQRGFERELRNWVNGYLALMREALHVAVDFIEWGARDVERLQGGVQVKAGDRLLVSVFPPRSAPEQTNSYGKRSIAASLRDALPLPSVSGATSEATRFL